MLAVTKISLLLCLLQMVLTEEAENEHISISGYTLAIRQMSALLDQLCEDATRLSTL
jgi:hypothetical protein